jgi:hypothetical protein
MRPCLLSLQVMIDGNERAEDSRGSTIKGSFMSSPLPRIGRAQKTSKIAESRRTRAAGSIGRSLDAC